MSKEKQIKFFYFKPYCYENSEEKDPFNFAEWIINFKKRGKIYETISLSNINARVDEFYYDALNNLYVVCFVNIRGDNLPSKLKNGEAQTDLDLKDDEYIGEDMYVLYDRNTNIFMMQSNRMSLTISRIAEFINTDLDLPSEDNNYQVGFKPILHTVSRNELKQRKIRSITLSGELLYDKDNLKSSSLNSICKAASDIKSHSFAVKFSSSRSKTDELSPQEAQEIIDDILNKGILASSGKVSTINEDGIIEHYDLIQNRLFSIIKYSLQEDNGGKIRRLHLKTIYEKMKKEYLDHVKKKLLSEKE